MAEGGHSSSAKFIAARFDAVLDEMDSEDDDSYHTDSSDVGHEASEDLCVDPSRSIDTTSSATGSDAASLRIHQLIKKEELEEMDNYLTPDTIELLCQRDRVNRTPLHVALLNGYASGVEKILEKAGPEIAAKLIQQRYRAKKDDLPVLHLAFSLAPFNDRFDKADRCVEILLDKATELNVNLIPLIDGVGRTALHIACDFGRARLVKRLLDNGADPFARDQVGQLPLHFAIDSCNMETLRLMIDWTKGQVMKRFTWFHPIVRCIGRAHWAAIPEFKSRGWMEDPEVILQFNKYAETHGLHDEWRDALAACEAGKVYEPRKLRKTVLVTHKDCFDHLAIPEDCDDPVLRLHLINQAVENPHRLEVITGDKGALRADEFIDIVWRDCAPECPIGDILRVHEFQYIRQLSSAIERTSDPGHHADSRNHNNKFKWVPFDRSDTKISTDSWQAARRAAGCVLEAVDYVLSGGGPMCKTSVGVRNAFCALRPPGHHVGPNGAVMPDDVTRDDPNGSQGFCLLNNVAIGAAYARCVYRTVVSKVAIVDFDVHHGNGTEAICRNVEDNARKVPCIDEMRELHGMRVKVTAEAPVSAKPWLDSVSDKECIFFSSIHGYGNGFYPGSGRTEHSKDGPEVVNVGVPRGTTSTELRALFHAHIIPPLLEFDPDLIFISAGFDGHSNDLIGCCQYNDEDYVWMTQELMKVANRCCDGRIVSVMEGGYNTRAGVLSPFASSVKGHLRALIRSSDDMSFLNVKEPEVDWEAYINGEGAYDREFMEDSGRRVATISTENVEAAETATKRERPDVADAITVTKRAHVDDVKKLDEEVKSEPDTSEPICESE
eukprot:GEMP01006156.1.p1 GENE.GEMP01006156.1~~GEMP01006156.1.p1  ORF type:complete len:835 (-),score=188.87 GEMP01006156.1:1360-3864(-)